MLSSTRRKAIALLSGCLALGAIGGAVAHMTQKTTPHLVVNNQPESELGITTIMRTAEDGEELVNDTASISATGTTDIRAYLPTNRLR